MIRTLTTMVGGVVAVVCVATTFAMAAPMICTQAQETILSSPNPALVRKDCIMAKGADGQERPVMVQNAKVGDKLDCAMQEGKMVCK
jgi:hypothetical protein